MPEIVRVLRAGDVSVIELNEPDNRNALSIEMREQLTDAFTAANADPSVRAIVMAGAGGNFCAGGDLKRTVGVDPDPPAIRTPRLLGLLHRLVREIACGAKPVIAAVDGSAFGAGLSLVTACDYVVAGPTARFCAVFGRVGLFPDAGLAWSLPNRVGPIRARQMVLTAEALDAEKALAYGLIDEIGPAGATLEHAIQQAQRFTGIAPLAAAHVRAVMGIAPLDMDEAFAVETRVQPILTATADYAEARAAFAERRRPQFVGQ